MSDTCVSVHVLFLLSTNVLCISSVFSVIKNLLFSVIFFIFVVVVVVAVVLVILFIFDVYNT